MVRPYNRLKCIKYAKEYAFDYNPAYYNYKSIGGDCTNFASQCLFAGADVMNYSHNGWYYLNANDKSPSWTGVEYFYQFLIHNKGKGPYGVLTNQSDIGLGDFIQLYDGIKYYHTLVVVDYDDTEIYIAAHTFDAFYRPLSSYNYLGLRCIKILNVRI